MIDWPRGETIVSARLRLEPLSVEHAADMVKVLADTSLYEYTGGEAPSLEELQRRYARQAAGHSDDGLQAWFNWIVVPRDADAPIGFVQATLEPSGPDLAATIAWVISPNQQGQGMASEAAQAMIIWLRSRGVHSFVAHVHPEHFASMGVARKQGLHPTGVIEDGEVRWES
ncbi:GNAT family N-acetyltransferase [Arthrobacter sp. H35-D1]|uniref:GNAT family N-acetyltransferase n=1 Tax=Arthrobacter sp. H35-D1 TaxID=3046202 RepID=UPI0024BA97FC|nr:GNAT family N-acetyltransferase [Arthrobacter sp. H35-D1]MDJ0314941.1 GNAT family N-acetyltransferase [Arthrobacter sp. H35-D1]